MRHYNWNVFSAQNAFTVKVYFKKRYDRGVMHPAAFLLNVHIYIYVIYWVLRSL